MAKRRTPLCAANVDIIASEMTPADLSAVLSRETPNLLDDDAFAVDLLLIMTTLANRRDRHDAESLLYEVRNTVLSHVGAANDARSSSKG